MVQFYNLLQSVLILCLLILGTFWLKKRGIVSREHESIFSRLVTDFVLPCLIFVSLSRGTFSLGKMIPAGIMLMSILLCCFLGWLIGSRLGLNRKQLGAFTLVAGFGSSSTLGYALISQVFPGNENAMMDGMIIGEFGACIPAFTIGSAIALYFGRDENQKASIAPVVLNFLRSPIFLALVAGLTCSIIGLPLKNPVVKFVHKFLTIIGNSLELIVAIGIGLMLRAIPFRKLAVWIIAIVSIKLIAEPLLAGAGGLLLDLPKLEISVLIIEAAMPSGAVAAVLAARYGCDGPTAASLTLGTYILSLITIPAVFWIFTILN
ncbi:AEC family transporter [bacterium]|nr:AEC family transporter [bacterium]